MEGAFAEKTQLWRLNSNVYSVKRKSKSFLPKEILFLFVLLNAMEFDR